MSGEVFSIAPEQVPDDAPGGSVVRRDGGSCGAGAGCVDGRCSRGASSGGSAVFANPSCTDEFINHAW